MTGSKFSHLLFPEQLMDEEIPSLRPGSASSSCLPPSKQQLHAQGWTQGTIPHETPALPPWLLCEASRPSWAGVYSRTCALAWSQSSAHAGIGSVCMSIFCTHMCGWLSACTYPRVLGQCPCLYTALWCALLVACWGHLGLVLPQPWSYL